jgi:hypothetical protein
MSIWYMNFGSSINNVLFHSGWQEQTTILDEMKLFFSHDTTLATLSSHDVSVYAETLRCKANIPLHIFPHDEYSARRILYQVRRY